MKKSKIALCAILVLFGGIIFAQESDDVRTAFKDVTLASNLSITVPTVVEVPFPDVFLERKGFLVFEQETGLFLPSFFNETYELDPVSITAQSNFGNSAALVDDKSETSVNFSLPEDREGIATIQLFAMSEPVKSSALVVELDRNVSLPSSIEIRVQKDGKEEIVVSRTKMTSSRVLFPQIEGDIWTIELTYIQPLRINEVILVQDDVEKQAEKGLRFLAQPGNTYEIYFNPDRTVRTTTTESGDLRDDKGVVLLSGISSTQNTRFAPADVDKDGVVDITDNCVSVANTDQFDGDGNGRGDACDDFDRDGYINSRDNCPNLPNRAQRDIDNDGIGDECDDEENRLTERYVWVPWVGMGVAAVVLITLFTIVALKPLQAAVNRPEEEVVVDQNEDDQQNG